MSAKVDPAILKSLGSLTAKVKDISGSGKRYQWSNLHRLEAREGRLTLYTNDGMVWLQWDIPLLEPTTDEYDVILSASQFNEMAKSSGNMAYDISRDSGLLILKQGSRSLKLREEVYQPYPIPQQAEDQNNPTWTFSPDPLLKALRFVTPFIEVNSATANRTVATWTPDGTLAAGSTRAIARVSGLVSPPVALSFKARAAKALTAFLDALGGDVSATVDAFRYTFWCPKTGNSLIIPSEKVFFPALSDLSNKETESLKLDAKVLLSGVSILRAILPTDTDRLLVSIQGGRENATIKVSTFAEESCRSTDESPIIREILPHDERPTQISVNCSIFEAALKEIKGNIIDVKYYANEKYLTLQDEKTSDADTTRLIVIMVQDNSTNPLDLIKNKKEEDEPEVEFDEEFSEVNPETFV